MSETMRDTSCTPCRILGTVVPLGLSAYFVGAARDIPRHSSVHRIVVLGVAGGCAALGVARAFFIP